MTLVSGVLYVHVLPVLLLVSAFSVEALMLTRFRQATSISQAHLWLSLVSRLPRMGMGALLVLPLSGSYLTANLSAGSLGWPKVAVGGLVLVALLGGATGKRMRAIRQGTAQPRRRRSDVSSSVSSSVARPFFPILVACSLVGCRGHRVAHDRQARLG
jgi:hypothetical protein